MTLLQKHVLQLVLGYVFFSDIDDCAGKTCNGVGQCQDGTNDYTCQCQQGFTGKDCETSKAFPSTCPNYYNRAASIIQVFP